MFSIKYLYICLAVLLLAGCVKGVMPRVYLPLTPREEPFQGCYKLQVGDNFNEYRSRDFKEGRLYEYIYLDNYMAILSRSGKIMEDRRQLLFPNDLYSFRSPIYNYLYWSLDTDKDIISVVISKDTTWDKFVFIPVDGTLSGVMSHGSDTGQEEKLGDVTAIKVRCDSIPTAKKFNR